MWRHSSASFPKVSPWKPSRRWRRCRGQPQPASAGWPQRSTTRFRPSSASPSRLGTPAPWLPWDIVWALFSENTLIIRPSCPCEHCVVLSKFKERLITVVYTNWGSLLSEVDSEVKNWKENNHPVNWFTCTTSAVVEKVGFRKDKLMMRYPGRETELSVSSALLFNRNTLGLLLRPIFGCRKKNLFQMSQVRLQPWGPQKEPFTTQVSGRGDCILQANLRNDIIL